MKVTLVEPQKRNLHRFNIFLDGVFAFGADEDLVVNFRLIPGKIIAKEDLDKLLFEAEVGKLMAKMYRLFGVRMRSEHEVRQYFRIKNLESRIKEKEPASDLAIELLIAKLKAKGMINDLQFARLWVESRRTSKKKGPNALKSELIQKGIDREIIVEVLNEDRQGESDEILAELSLEKKLNSWIVLPYLKQKQKAVDFLLRKGFDYSIVKPIVEKLIKK